MDFGLRAIKLVCLAVYALNDCLFARRVVVMDLVFVSTCFCDAWCCCLLMLGVLI